MTTHPMLINLTHLGLLSITGEDAQKFLQGQLTCHLAEVTAMQSRLGAHCNPQGRIISLFRLFFYRNGYYLQMPRISIPFAMQALQKYAVFFKVKLTDASDELTQIAYVNEERSDWPQTVDAQFSTEDFVTIRLTGPSTRYLWVGHPRAFHASMPLSPITAWNKLEIMQSIPAIYPETSALFLPHDLDLPTLNAVSFNKGCYTGQEIIARMQYRAKLKTHLYQAQVNTKQTIVRGNPIYLADKCAGYIVDYVQTDPLRYLLLVTAQEAEVATHQLFIDSTQQDALVFLK